MLFSQSARLARLELTISGMNVGQLRNEIVNCLLYALGQSCLRIWTRTMLSFDRYSLFLSSETSSLDVEMTTYDKLCIRDDYLDDVVFDSLPLVARECIPSGLDQFLENLKRKISDSHQIKSAQTLFRDDWMSAEWNDRASTRQGRPAMREKNAKLPGKCSTEQQLPFAVVLWTSTWSSPTDPKTRYP